MKGSHVTQSSLLHRSVLQQPNSSHDLKAKSDNTSADDLEVKTSPTFKALQDANVDISALAKPFIESSELFNALKERKLLIIDKNDHVAKQQIQTLVADLSSKHIQGKPMVPDIDLANMSELGGRINKLAQALQAKNLSAAETLTSKLEKVINQGELTNREKQNQIAGLVLETSKKIDAGSTKELAFIMERLAKHLIQDELSDRLTTKQKNASDKISGSTINLQKHVSNLNTLTEQVKAQDSYLGNKLESSIQSTLQNHNLSDKEKSEHLTKLLKNTAIQLNVQDSKEVIHELQMEAKTIANEASKQTLTLGKKSLLNTLAKDLSTQNKELGASIKAQIDSILKNKMLSHDEQFHQVKMLLSNTAKALNEKQLPELEDKVTTTLEKVNAPKPKTATRVIGLDRFHADLTTPTASHQGQMAGNLSEKSILGLDATGSANIELARSQITLLSGGVAIPTHIGTVGLNASVKNQSAQQEGGEIHEGRQHKAGVAFTAGPLSFGVEASKADVKIFNNSAHLTEHIPLSERAAMTALILGESQLASEEIDVLTIYANDRDKIRDETDRLTFDLQRIGVLEEGEYLKLADNKQVTVPQEESSKAIAADAGMSLNIATIAALSGKLKTLRKDTIKSEFGDKIDHLQASPASMKKALESYNFSKIQQQQKEVIRLAQNPTENIQEQTKLEAELKEQILENLQQQQAYVAALRQEKDVQTYQSHSSNLVTGIGRLAVNLMNAFQDNKTEAQIKKTNIEQELHTQNEAQTLEKLLIKHAALSKAYQDLSDIFPEGMKQQSINDSQSQLIDALDLEQHPRANDVSTDANQFLALLEKANQELQSPNATLSLETMEMLQKVSENVEKDFTTIVTFDASVGVGTVHAEVSHKHPLKTDESGEERKSETLINLKGNVNFDTTIIQQMIGRAQDSTQQSAQGNATTSIQAQNQDFLQLMAPALKPEAEVEIKLEGEEIVLGNVTLKTNISTITGNVDAKVMTSVTDKKDDKGEVVISLKASISLNQNQLEQVFGQLKHNGFIDDASHDNLLKEYKERLDDTTFTVAENSKELEIRLRDGQIILSWK